MTKWKTRIIHPPNRLFADIAPFPPTYQYRLMRTPHGTLIPRDYPLTLYTRTSNNHLLWIGFVYAYIYWNRKKNLVLRLERLTAFPTQHHDKHLVYRHLIDECTKLARLLGVTQIETEVYTASNTDIYFPSTLSFVNSYNDLTLIKIFHAANFKPKKTEYVFTLPFHRSEPDQSPLPREYSIDNYRYTTNERTSYWSLWHQSSYCLEAPSSTTWNWALDYGMNAADSPQYIKFTRMRNRVIGFVHWLPNFYRLQGTPWEHMPSVKLLNHMSGKWGGKIFKTVIDPNFESDCLHIAMCVEATNAMRALGMTHMQIGSIYAHDTAMMHAIKQLKGQLAHTLTVLEKQLT